MEKEFEKKYHQTEKKHFWFKARRKYILQLLKNQPKHAKILDIGCSSGLLLKELIDSGFDSNNLFGIDISSQAIKNCKENGITNAFVMDAQSTELNTTFDVIIASDCLEHIKNDEKALENWHHNLKPNGLLLVFVPAYKILWSTHDDVNMHFRRYTKNELKRKLEKNCFKINKSSYWNFFLFFPVLLIRLFFKLNPAKNGDLNQIPRFNSFFYHLVNFENKLLNYFNFPFGVSAFCIAKKKSPVIK